MSIEYIEAGFIAFFSVLFWIALGAFLFFIFDDEEESMYSWYMKFPSYIQLMLLISWPVVLFARLIR